MDARGWRELEDVAKFANGALQLLVVGTIGAAAVVVGRAFARKQDAQHEAISEMRWDIRELKQAAQISPPSAAEVEEQK